MSELAGFAPSPAAASGGTRWSQALQRALASKRAPVALALLAFVLGLPSLGSGAWLDDHWVRANIGLGAVPWAICSLDDADIVRARAIGALPWWGSRELHVHFLRPLASLSHWVEWVYWPNALWAMHLINLLSYAALVWVAADLYRRLKLAPWSAGVAGLMFALDGKHAMGVGWISGRNTILVALFTLASLRAYIVSAPRPSLWSALAFALALGCGESGVCALVFIGARALTSDQAPLGARLRALWPHALVVLTWAACYAGLDAGARGITLYRGADAPLFTLGQGLLDTPVWISALLGPGVANASLAFPLPVVRALGLLLAVPLVLAVLPTLRSDARARYFALTGLACLLPLFATLPQDRLLFSAGFAAFGLIACVFERAARLEAPAARVSAGVFATLHVVLAPALFLQGLGSAGMIQDTFERTFERVQGAGGREIVLLNAPSDWVTPAAWSMLFNAGLPAPASLHLLYSGSGAVVVERVDDRTLELSVARGWGGPPVESMVSPSVPGLPVPGDVFALKNLQVQVVSATASGLPARVRFEFPTPLEAAGRDFYFWGASGPVRWTPPSAGGSTLPPIDVFASLLAPSK